jgi:hypothetical protein
MSADPPDGSRPRELAADRSIWNGGPLARQEHVSPSTQWRPIAAAPEIATMQRRRADPRKLLQSGAWDWP